LPHADAARRACVRRPPAAVPRAGGRLRPLRVLPAHLPDLCALGRGDGLASRPHLPDETGPRGRADDARDGAAHRQVPRLHGLRDRLPVRGAVRQADRGYAGPGGTPVQAVLGRAGAADRDLRVLSPSAAATADARTVAASPGQWVIPTSAQVRSAATDLTDAGGHGGAGATSRACGASARAYAGTG